MVDFHGSTGYGQAFTDAIRGDWGGKPLEDLQKGLDGGARAVPVDGRGAGLRARRVLRRLHDQLDRRPVARPLPLPRQPRRQPRRAHGLLRHRGAVVPRVGARRHAVGRSPRATRSTTRSTTCANWKTPTLVVHGARDYRVVDTQGLSDVHRAAAPRDPERSSCTSPTRTTGCSSRRTASSGTRRCSAWLDRWTAP